MSSAVDLYATRSIKARPDSICAGHQVGFAVMITAAFLIALAVLAWAASAASGSVGTFLDRRDAKKKEAALTEEQKQKLVTAHSQSYHDYGAINQAHASVETKVRVGGRDRERERVHPVVGSRKGGGNALDLQTTHDATS
jgi:hypothetical protein